MSIESGKRNRKMQNSITTLYFTVKVVKEKKGKKKEKKKRKKKKEKGSHRVDRSAFKLGAYAAFSFLELTTLTYQFKVKSCLNVFFLKSFLYQHIFLKKKDL